MSSAMRELRGLVADRLIWWAWRLDRDRFLAVGEKCRPVVETYSRGAAYSGNRIAPSSPPDMTKYTREG